MRLVDSSTLSNQDISTALLCHTYTADAARGVFVQVYADQLVGNGTYTLYRTIQKNGAGSAYEQDSRESLVVPTGITAILGAFDKDPLFLQANDVLKIYLLGLGGDTTTPDIRTEIWEDDSLRPTTADRTLDVSATGEAGMDWNNIGAPTTTVNLSGTSTKAVEPTTAGRTLDIAATGEAGLDFSNIKQAAAPTTLTDLTIPTVTTLTNAPSDSTGVTTLLARLTATRAGFMDYLDTRLDIVLSTVKTVVDAIQAKTDLLPSDPADESAVEAAISAAQLAVITQTDIIKAKTNNLPASPAAVGSQMDLVNAPNATAVTAIQSGLATAANLTTLMNRVGAFTGTGVNTVLGFFRALASKTVSLPSDLTSGGLTFDNTTDSTEAIRDRGDAAWTGGGAAPTAGQVADAVWDEARAGHVTAGTFGEGVASVQGNVTGSVASVTGNVGGDLVGNVTGNVEGTISDSAGVTTLLSRVTDTRAGYLDYLAVLAGWSGTLLTAIKALARKNVTSVDIAGTYDETTDSQEALREQLDVLAGEPPQVVNVEINELNT